ncbi:dipeptidylpeptidase, partial [Linderina macrospora]
MVAMGSRVFTPEDLVQTNRFSGPVAIAPDSHAIAYIQTHYSIDAKQQSTELFVQPLSDSKPTKLVTFSSDARPNPPLHSASPVASSDRKSPRPSQPVWLSAKTLGFVSANPQTGGSTLYATDFEGRKWTEPHVVVEFPVPINDVQYHVDASILAFTAEVHNATQSLEDSARFNELDRERADTAKVYEDLWVRLWDTLVTPKVPQIYTLALQHTIANTTRAAPGQARNILRDTMVDGRLEVSSSFVFAPDGHKVAFVARRPGADYAYRVTSFVYLADVDGSKAESINEGNIGVSASPVFSPDSSRVAFLQMAKSQYAADRNQIKIYDTASKSTHDVAHNWDRSPFQLLWADDKTLLAVYDDWGRIKLAKIDIASGTVTPIVSSHTVGAVQVLPGTDRLLIDYSAIDSPTDLYTVKVATGELSRVTELNPQFRETIYLSKPEELRLTGVDNSTIHGYLVHPPSFDARNKYPLAFLIHGGPQSSFTDSWSTRWNLNIFAAAGFVTVALNPQGSTGYGQEFTDTIRNQWGGKP